MTDRGADLAPTELRAHDIAQRSEPAAYRAPDLPPRQIVQQILDRIQVRNGSVEVSLSPEELGRLTLSLAAQDGTLTVTITAERSETIDLIRRHADLLHQEARAAGYGSVSFGFSDHQPKRHAGRESDLVVQEPAPPTAGLHASVALPRSASANAGTLDLRM